MGGRPPGHADERGEWAVNGSAYDPDRGRWREIAPAPVERVYHSDGLWTGRLLVVWGSHHPPGRQLRDEAGPSFAAAYDPAADRWQQLPAPPVEHPAEAAGMWTGREVILWGQPPLAHRSGAPRVGASLDPLAVDEGWRLLPAVDVDTRPSTSVYGLSHAWTSAGAVFYGGYPESVGLVYDPDDRSWLRLPSHRARVNAVAVWRGRGAVALGRLHHHRSRPGPVVLPATAGTTVLRVPRGLDRPGVAAHRVVVVAVASVEAAGRGGVDRHGGGGGRRSPGRCGRPRHGALPVSARVAAACAHSTRWHLDACGTVRVGHELAFRGSGGVRPGVGNLADLAETTVEPARARCCALDRRGGPRVG